MRNKKLNGHKERIQELMAELFKALHDDIKVLEDAEALWVKADEMLEDNIDDGCLSEDTVMAMLKVIAFVFDSARVKDERILDIADDISVELNMLKNG